MTATKPETFDSYTAAMSWVQANLPDINKGSTNPAFKSKYADLADVSKAVLAVTSQAGLAWTCTTMLDDAGRFLLVGTMKHVTGGEEIAVWPLPTGSPQQVGSSMTYGRRYLLSCVTGAVADEDDDGNAASQARPAQRKAERGPAPAEQDPWSTTPVRRPPDPAAAAEITAAVAGCDDLPTLRKIRKDVVAKAADGTLPESDAADLLTLIDETGADLRTKYEAEQVKAATK